MSSSCSRHCDNYSSRHRQGRCRQGCFGRRGHQSPCRHRGHHGHCYRDCRLCGNGGHGHSGRRRGRGRLYLIF